MMVLWLDDLRNPKDFNKDTTGWLWAKNSSEFMTILGIKRRDISEIHFDNDLGEEVEGYTLFCQVEMLLMKSSMPNLKTIYVHSANPSARVKFNSAKNIFKEMYGIDIIMRNL